jgi:hypothetical protein
MFPFVVTQYWVVLWPVPEVKVAAQVVVAKDDAVAARVPCWDCCWPRASEGMVNTAVRIKLRFNTVSLLKISVS